MRSTIIIGHGHFASGLVSALEMISGKQKRLYALDWTEDMSPYVLKEQLKKLIEKIIGDSSGIFIFVDMKNATPYQVAKSCIEESDWTSKLFLRSQVHLPMLLDYLYLANTLSNEEVYEQIKEKAS